jgi:tetratricopeptide (TPR) repeat protein
MRKFLFSILCFVVVCQLIGCGSGEVQRRQLAELEEQNHSGQSMLNDSLAEALVAYFDRHGSANERMRAKYILGRTYYCLGELPRALETYFEAADCADTTASDCDFAKLSRIHAQSADVFHKQIQPRSELKELRLAEYYAKRGNDTLMAIECYAQQSDAFMFLHEDDSVIIIKETASKAFLSIGRVDRAALTLGSIISLLIKKNEIEKAKDYLNLYESESGCFGNDLNIENRSVPLKWDEFKY